MHPIVFLLLQILSLFKLLIFIWVILSLLIYFKIVNPYQPLVYKINLALNRLMDPILKPIRNLLPPMGGIDLSPVILLILLQTLEYAIHYYSYRY